MSTSASSRLLLAGEPLARRLLSSAALLSATVFGLALAPPTAQAQDVIVVSGDTFELTANESIGSLNIQSGGTVELNSFSLLVNDNADTIYSGTTHGVINGSQLIKAGSGTVTLDSYTQDGGEFIVGAGALRLDAGASLIRYLAVGSGSGGSATMTMTGGTLSISGDDAIAAPTLQVGDFGGIGIFNQSGGLVEIGEGAGMNIGNQGGTGTYNLSGGELRLVQGLFSLGRSTTDARNSDGTMNVSGTGLLNIQSGNFVIGDRDITGANSSSHGEMVQTGGTVRVNPGAGLFLSGFDNAGAAIDGRYDLLGGTLEVGGTGLTARYNNGTATYVFNLGGGTIKVIGSQLSTSVDATLVNGSESVIDTNGLGAVFSGVLGGTGGLAKLGGGTLSLQNGGNSFTGGIRVEAGTLTATVDGALPDGNALAINGGTLDLNGFGLQATALSGSGGTLHLGTATLTLDQAVDTVFAGAIEGDGGLTKNGAGQLELTGTSGYAGATAVTGGTLVVNGSIANSLVTLSGDARLGGNATLGGLVVQGGTTLAPGNSIGTVNVTDATFIAGSTFEVEIDSAGNSDLLDASGTVTILGGTVQVLTALGTQVDTPYLIVNAVNPIAGVGFDDVQIDSLFLDALLDYSVSTQVLLQLTRNATSFASTAATPNQTAVAEAADDLPPGNPVVDALSTLGSAAEAQAAFDLLSGEIFASGQALLLNDSRFLREAVSRRLTGEPQGVKQPVLGTPAEAWIEGFGSWGSAEGDDNAASADRDIGGFFVGLDAALDPGVTLGLLAGYSHASIDVDSRASDLSVDSFHVGAYAGADFGGFGLQFGGAFAWHTVDSTRRVAFDGVDETLTADYNARTGQVFGEVGYRFDFAPLMLQPFAGLAYVNVASDGFTEDGGDMALTADDESSDAFFSTLGLRGEAAIDAMAGLRLRGSVGWRHSFGADTPEAGLAFQGGGDFTVEGLPLAQDTVVVEAGLGLNVMTGITVGLNYSGQMGDGLSDQGFNASLRVSF
jgi:fibronectin-binding autotransporter adhesin